jgi:hypothetical protein
MRLWDSSWEVCLIDIIACGKTFHRADGSKVELPLTVNPAPKHNANFKSTRQQVYWNLYQSLIRKVHGG